MGDARATATRPVVPRTRAPAGGPSRARRTRLRRAAALELAWGSLLLLAAALAGVLFVHRPWPNRLDAAGFSLLHADPSSRLYADVASAGSLRALAAGALFAAAVAVWRDRARAVACVVGPAVAVAVTEWVAKPLVGRHLTVLGGNSYPSGTVTAVAAVAVAVLLAVPRTLRLVLVLPAVALVVAVSVAVVAMRWHYPTDACGGALVGAGTVLVLDALVHLPGRRGARRHAARIP
ncbi:MAG: phosphatase PAP2 family protein [Actinomycetota bacterium]|nr:phosphatase PAP2 family protein [Actinomycetota bacterium]